MENFIFGILAIIHILIYILFLFEIAKRGYWANNELFSEEEFENKKLHCFLNKKREHENPLNVIKTKENLKKASQKRELTIEEEFAFYEKLKNKEDEFYDVFCEEYYQKDELYDEDKFSKWEDMSSKIRAFLDELVKILQDFFIPQYQTRTKRRLKKQRKEKKEKLSEAERVKLGQELYALRFCHVILDMRIARDTQKVWDWEIKRKVAIYCIQNIQRRLQNAQVNDLVPEITKKRSILENHPLLQPQKNATSFVSSKHMELQHRVKEHIQRIYSEKKPYENR